MQLKRLQPPSSPYSVQHPQRHKQCHKQQTPDIYFFCWRSSTHWWQPHMPGRAYIPPPHTKWTKEPTKQSCQKAPNPSNLTPAIHPHENQAEARLEHPKTPARSPKPRVQQAKDLHKSPELMQQSHVNSECSMPRKRRSKCSGNQGCRRLS